VVAGDRHELGDEPLTIGRAPECDLVLDDQNVSRRHAELRPVDGGWVVADLGSTNGVELNGRRVETAALADGDRIVLGQTELRFEQL
jgi:pSer/pThr/pTyr-binding forkhead associated (FHA) protein